MTTIEREQTVLPAPGAEPERPVFVAGDGRRARLLRLVACAVAVLAVLWLVALAAGMLGFGQLPGVSIPVSRLGGSEAEKPKPDRRRQAPSTSGEQRPGRAVVASLGAEPSPRSGTRASRVTARPAARQRALRRQARKQTPASPQPVQPLPPQAVPPQQGWARQGRSAPPGHVRRAEAQPPPSSRGNGRAKKELTPPPPPPPPEQGNGDGGGPKKPKP